MRLWSSQFSTGRLNFTSVLFEVQDLVAQTLLYYCVSSEDMFGFHLHIFNFPESLYGLIRVYPTLFKFFEASDHLFGAHRWHQRLIAEVGQLVAKQSKVNLTSVYVWEWPIESVDWQDQGFETHIQLVKPRPE